MSRLLELAAVLMLALAALACEDNNKSQGPRVTTTPRPTEQQQGTCDEAVAAAGFDATELCRLASSVADQLARGDLAAIIESGQPTTYTCAAGGNVAGAEYSDMCRGEPIGTLLAGFPLAIHGSHGGPRSKEQLLTELNPVLKGAELVAVACPVDVQPCSKPLVVFQRTGEAFSVAYLVFERVSNQAGVTGIG